MVGRSLLIEKWQTFPHQNQQLVNAVRFLTPIELNLRWLSVLADRTVLSFVAHLQLNGVDVPSVYCLTVLDSSLLINKPAVYVFDQIPASTSA